MMSEKKEAESYEYQLRILSIRMKMKFPCRMALQYQKQPITKEVPSTDQNKFVFNELVTLRGDGDGFVFQILASLYTQKGTKYTSGSMKWLSAELLRSKGERLIIPLTKCVDPDAFCELVVEGVKDLKDSQLNLSSNSKVLNSQERPDIVSPLPKKISSERYLMGETRSEVNYQALLGMGSADKPREGGPKSQVFKTFTKSPNSKFSTIKYTTYNGNNIANNLRSEFPIEQAVQRSSFDESQVYRQGYLKLKEKFKKESELLKEQNRKRAALQANENTLKLEMMKVRVRAEQLEKQLSDKNQKIKSLSLQLTDLQKKDLDLAYVRQECNNLQRKNKIQEDTISSLVADNNALKKLMAQKSDFDEKSIGALRQQLQLARNKADELGYQFQLQLKAKQNIILTKNNDVLLRNDTIQRQKRLIRELQEQAEARMFDFERSLIAQRNILQLKIDELAAKVVSAQSEKSGVQQKNALLQQEIQKLNATITTLQFGKKVLTEEAAVRAAQITDLKAVRDKFNQLTRQHRFLQQQFTTVRKNLQSSLQNKEINLTELLKQYQQGKERNDKTKTQQQEKIKFITAKYMQGESTIILLNNNIEKSKRINESLTRENSSLREQNKQIREDYKNIERRFIALENQYSAFSHRNQRENVTLKGVIQKLKEDRAAADKQVDALQDKLDRLGERLKEFQQKEAQWKIKQRHFQQRIQKQVSKSKESSAKYEAIIQDQRHIINESVSSYDSLNNDHHTLKKHTNQLQFAAIRQREGSEKLKHTIKLSQERIISLQAQIKHKLDEEKQLKEKMGVLQIELAEKDQQLAKFKDKQVQLISKAAKQDQIVEMLNKDVAKLQKQAEQLTAAVKAKEENEQKLRQDLKLEKQEVVKERIKTNKVQSDFQKFKESISDIIRIQFTRILNTPTTTQKNTDRLRESQISNAKSERSHRSKTALDAGALSSNLLQKLHETKSSLWKMVQLNRFLKEQNTRLLAQNQNQSNKYEFAQLELHRDIQLLEDQMNNLMSDKETQCQNYDQLLVDLNFRLKEKESENQELRSQIAEYEAIVNCLKTDFEANNELNDKKVASLKQSSSELQERIEYLNLNVACLQDKNHELQEKTIEQENDIIACKEILIKGEQALLDLRESEAKLLASEENLKRELKSLQQKCVQLQMMCNGEKEGKAKALDMLEEQEKKCQKLNDFVNGLIAQKQAAIKSELQKSQQNNQLQNQIFELTHQKDLLQDQATTLKRKLEQSKQQSKSLQKNIKFLEKQLSEQRSKNVRSLQKIKERQSDLQIKKEYIKDLEQRYRQLRDKNYKEIRQLSNQLEDKNLIAINASKELNEKIIKVETESKKRYEQAIALQQEIEIITKQLYAERDRVQDLTIERDRLREEKMSLDEELLSREFALQERAEQIKRLQQLVGELRFQVHNLQAQCEAQEKEFNHHIQELSNDYNSKLQQTAKQNAHNQTILSADASQIRAKTDALEEQLQKAQIQLKTHLQQHAQKIAGYEEKLRKIENQRMLSIQAKNAEIKKIGEDMRAVQEQLREKQAQTRRLAIQVEHRKIQETEIQGKLSQAAERAKNKEKVLQREIEGLKTREKLAVENKQKLLTNLHENEAQIRKLISEAVKKLIQNCCKADSEKVHTTMKNLQSNVTQAMIGAKLTK